MNEHRKGNRSSEKKRQHEEKIIQARIKGITSMRV
jgi:hypothetical protein